MTKPFKTTAIIAILIFMACSATAQDSYLKNRWNLKLAGAHEYKMNSKLHNAFLSAEANYGIFNNFELGVALGFENKYNGWTKDPNTNLYIYEYYLSPTYNLHLNYHLLPYLTKGNHPKFDLYLSGRLGGSYTEYRDLHQTFFWNYYLGGGLAWYFTRYVGIYTEYGRQYHFNSNYTKNGFRFGIAVKF
jgi:hypothetical protein